MAQTFYHTLVKKLIVQPVTSLMTRVMMSTMMVMAMMTLKTTRTMMTLMSTKFENEIFD